MGYSSTERTKDIWVEESKCNVWLGPWSVVTHM